ncbi:MAG: phosphonopyruvate decarboxylase [Proteobacteria bacterium]|nr:phosphonopyruvate decarboxylase [Pseudomonadota bacterium]
MIEAKEFVEAARELGFSRYTGVPCSYLTPFINYVINDDALEYVSSANEGDALATAAGSTIGGQRSIVMMQNSGLGNAVSPITSLSYVFRIPFLIITTHRGQPGVKDEPQHELMGQITKELFDLMRVPWEIFPDNGEDIAPALQRADEYMKKERRPYAFIMEKGTVAAQPLNKNPVNDISERKTEIHASHNPEATLSDRSTVLQRIIDHSPENKSVLIATTGFSGRELFAINDRPNQIYMVGSMGCASSLGLGLALARPDLKVVVIDGDGAGLMRMGNFATIGSYAGNNLIHILLDNEVHDSTGGQATVAGNINFALIAKASGYSVSLTGNEIDLINELFSLDGHDGPVFGHLKIRSGTIDNLPRPDITPNQVITRLMQHIDSSF